ncbi:MAG: hypothetical protein Q9187_007075 [Circinaria calcarea]
MVWQSWAGWYFFDEYLRGDGARVRTVEELRAFVDDFESLVAEEGGWTSKKNGWYKKCFDVDMDRVCTPGLSQKEFIPKFRPWVRVHVIENVKPEAVQKFVWEV